MANKKNNRKNSSNYQSKRPATRKKNNSSSSNNGRKGLGFLIVFLIIFLIIIIIKWKDVNLLFDKNGGFFSKFKITQNNLSNDNPKKSTSEIDEQNKTKTRDATIYFTLIKDDNLILKPVKRTISYIDNPLEETLKSLMKGPTEEENKIDIVTDIPDMTELKSVSVKNGIAHLDFSSEFEWNNYGRDSIINQLKQVVYTATEFSNIKGVQFLIDGEIKDYLGGDGIMINKILTRADF